MGDSHSANMPPFLRRAASLRISLGAPPRARPGTREERLASILSRHFDGAWLFARRLGVDEGELDDVMQEVGAIIAERLDEIGHGSEQSFVFSTIFRVASEYRRRRLRRKEVGEELAEVTVDPRAGPDALHERGEARALLDHILDAMPMELRAVFVLYEIEERSKSEIAAMLDIPAGTVASRLRRAREDFDARVVRWQAKHRGPT